MANSKLPKCCSMILLFLTVFTIFANATPVNIPLSSVSNRLIQSALDSLNDSSIRHNYKSGDLISAQKLPEPLYVVYRLTLNLEPNCSDDSSCPREACTIVLHQYENDEISAEKNSIRCMDLQPQSDQANSQRRMNNEGERITQEPEIMDSRDEKNTSSSSLILDHEIQTVTDGAERPFIAVRAMDRNYCAGCPYELKTSLPSLAAYGEQIVRAMDETGISEFKHRVVDFVRVTRAVPPGSNVVVYEILLEIGETNCPRIAISSRTDCPVMSDKPLKLCFVRFEERPWQQNSRKIVANNCTDLPDTRSELTSNLAEPLITSDALYVMNETNRRNGNEKVTEEKLSFSYGDAIDDFFEISTESSSLGTKLDEETKILPVTEESRRKIFPEAKNDDKLRLDDFHERLKDFDDFLVNIDFDMPLRERETEIIDDRTPVTEELIRPEIATRRNSLIRICNEVNDEEEEKENGERERRTIIDTERQFASRLAEKALDQMNDIDSDKRTRVLLEIIDSNKQPGKNDIYHLKMRIIEYNDIADTTGRTRVTRDESEKICHAQIRVNVPGSLEAAKLLQSSCFDEPRLADRRSRRHLVGSRTPVNIDDPIIRRYATKGLREYSKIQSDGISEPCLAEIVNATRQVVSGSLYRIVVKFGVKSAGNTENCQSATNSENDTYVIEIWSQPWIDKEEINVKALAANKRITKRSLRGENYSAKMLKLGKTMRAFENFVKEHGKSYESAEERNYRFTIFQDNMMRIEKLRTNEKGSAIYGATIFADLTPDEFRAKHLGLRMNLRSDNDLPLPIADIPDIALPEEFDWRHRNVVTEVKNQGSCGSCWAFSVTGNIESLNAIKHGKLLSLSEQELVDCDKIDAGCEGGLPDNAYRAIEEIGGLELESDYPYDGENEKCHFDKKKVRVNVVSGLNITSNETRMAQWLVKNGPISIAINANAMQFYMGGVSHPYKFLCDGDNLDHGVLIVGYGIHTYPIFKKKMPYWIIKNSWGPKWGEKGYYRVYRGDGTCGLNRMATSAIIA